MNVDTDNQFHQYYRLCLTDSIFSLGFIFYLKSRGIYNIQCCRTVFYFSFLTFFAHVTWSMSRPWPHKGLVHYNRLFCNSQEVSLNNNYCVCGRSIDVIPDFSHTDRTYPSVFVYLWYVFEITKLKPYRLPDMSDISYMSHPSQKWLHEWSVIFLVTYKTSRYTTYHTRSNFKIR
jgi:hypothetical protein